MNIDYDVLIIGSGPAGVSAAFPLVESGLKVLMVDGGKSPKLTAPTQNFLDNRRLNNEQWKTYIGEDFYALKNIQATSPKLRTPIHSEIFDDFQRKNKIISENFISIGSLSQGGLSNAWGCGVAKFSEQDLEQYPFSYHDLAHSYEKISKRIGISGCNQDDLANYFGIDRFCQPPIDLDINHRFILNQYQMKSAALRTTGFTLGRSRVAALSRELSGRSPCDRSSNCLWGCSNNSLYNATQDIAHLCKYSNFKHIPGLIIEDLKKQGAFLTAYGERADTGDLMAINAKKIFLAAGTLATSRIALKALNYRGVISIQSSPTAAFLIIIPRHLGVETKNSFGLGQLSYSLELKNGLKGFGSTFSINGILMSEFLSHIPMTKKNAIALLRNLWSACLVGNIFMPGCLSNISANLDDNGALNIKASNSFALDATMLEAKNKLRSAYRSIGALLMPLSFQIAKSGADIHYACSFPMKVSPGKCETSLSGELFGCDGVHLVDGSSLSALPEKSHTLTIMANADRIGAIIAKELMANSHNPKI